MARLILSLDGQTLAEYNMTKERYTVGRLPDNDILANGSGVGLGDYDQDGRPDLYLAGVERGNALYRNLGGMRFEDVTEAAGVALAAFLVKTILKARSSRAESHADPVSTNSESHEIDLPDESISV